LGSAFGKGVTKVATDENFLDSGKEDGRVSEHGKLAKVDDDGVTFRSYIDGSEHRFTPERSIEIQHNIGADIIVAFDECTSPIDTREYQEIALKRTHNWAKRSLSHHKQLGGDQALYGVIQGGAYEDLRTHAAETVGALDFDGFGIGGSFTKSDIGTAVHWVNNNNFKSASHPRCAWSRSKLDHQFDRKIHGYPWRRNYHLISVQLVVKFIPNCHICDECKCRCRVCYDPST
jgi:hypothetical protein